MYDVNIQKHKDYYKAYYFKTKNMYNQTLFLEISPDRISQKNTMYFVTFTINSKRKQGYQYLKSTGKDGLKSLMWAKQCIEYFINNILNSEESIVIYADNSQRFKVYEYGLRKLKFQIQNILGNKALIYKKNNYEKIRMCSRINISCNKCISSYRRSKMCY